MDEFNAVVSQCKVVGESFCSKTGFLYLELAFSNPEGSNPEGTRTSAEPNETKLRNRVVMAKFVDTFASSIGFWIFGYAFSGNTSGFVTGEEQDYIFWFFRFTFASNTATIIGGTLVGQKIQLRIISVFCYAFFMSSFIHPPLARWMWSAGRNEDIMFSPFRFCNGTLTVESHHSFSSYSADEDLGEIVFLDFAGSGVVHLCGGTAAFILQIFHKAENYCHEENSKEYKILYYFRKYQKYIMKIHCQLPNSRSEDLEHQPITQQIIQTPTNTKSCMAEYSISEFLDWMYPASGGEGFLDNAVLGVLILWTTWFGFNTGSTESIERNISHATVGRIALVMTIAAASGGLCSAIISFSVQIYQRGENFNTNEIANGVLACLVAVTGCCPFIDPPVATAIGVLTILIYHFGCYCVWALGLKDGARVVPVHAFCGLWGVICVGMFSRSCLIKEVYETTCYCSELVLPETLESQGYRFGYQLLGAVIIFIWSALSCFVLFLILWLVPFGCILNFIVNRIFCSCRCKCCKFNDTNKRGGRIKFKGNMLFTHFGEIDKFINEMKLQAGGGQNEELPDD